MNDLSLQAALKLRHGEMPHVAPRAMPVSSRAHLDLIAPAGSEPIAVLSDTRRNLTWHVALTPCDTAPDGSGLIWRCDILLPSEETVVAYRFVLNNGRVIRERRQIEGVAVPGYGVWKEKDFRIASYDPRGAPPAWTRGAVMYQIFPDRFAVSDPTNRYRKGGKVYDLDPIYPDWSERPHDHSKANEFYGGDLRGVIEQLDYIESLGVTCIYFTPIFESPTPHRYDATDYFKVDTRLGSEDELRELIVEAKSRGIRVMLDGVFNHCSSESEYFRQARISKASPWFRCFEFTPWKRVYPPQPQPDAPWSHMMDYPLWPNYVGWASVRTMPEWVECPEMESFFFGPDGVAPYWMKTGIAGWRTDVSPWLSDAFWRRFCRVARAIDPEVFLISEDWGDCTHRFLGDTFHATMNYRFGHSVLGLVKGSLSPSEFDDRLETIRRDYAEPFFQAQMTLIDSHDTARALSVLGEDVALLRVAASLLFGYPGVPSIFAGDEAGVSGASMDEGRMPFPWGRENHEILEFYRTAIHARRQSAALSEGNVEAAVIDDERRIYGFWRINQSDHVLVIANLGDEDRTIAIPTIADSSAPRVLLGPATCALNDSLLRVVVPARSAAWVKCGS